MGLSLAALSLSMLFNVSGDLLRWIGVGSTFIYVAFFAISLGPVFWIMIAEIYPLRIRGFAMSFATALSWMSNLIVSFSFPVQSPLDQPAQFIEDCGSSGKGRRCTFAKTFPD